MAPLWWELLFMMFFITYILVNTLIYFSIMKPLNKNMSDKKISDQIKWSW
nr:ATP synthase F0 subunit 8 [Aelia fieberi]UXW64332.1 ATP synthase F0 subunit 8 [Aelia fieberi]